MTTIYCTENCIHQKEGFCHLNEVHSKHSLQFQESSHCAYFETIKNDTVVK